MTLEEYFQQEDAERILLIEIVRNDASSTKYYLSDSDYITEHDDTPANRFYSPVVGGTGLSDIRKFLNDPFSGQASTGFGQITLADELVWTDTGGGVFDETPIYLVRGALVTAWLAGPSRDFSRSAAIQILKGKIGRSGGSSNNEWTFEVLDGSQEISDKLVQVQNKPLCFGYCRNITPFLTNPSLLEYHVHDGQIEEVLAVYDQGSLLTLTTDYSVDLSTGKITLVSSPTGIVTADVRGAKVSGTWLDSTEEISAELISRAGVSITQTYDIPSGVIGLYVTESTPLGVLLNQLMAGLAGYWLIDSNNNFYAAQYPVPQESVAVASYDSTQILSEVRIEGEDRVYNKINYSYRKNWTQYQSLPSSSTEQADFSQRQYLQALENSPSPDAEIVYQESPQLNTFFDSQTDAQFVAKRLLSIYEVQRKIYSVDLPYAIALDLGDNVSIAFGTNVVVGCIISIIDVFDGGFPVNRVQILA